MRFAHVLNIASVTEALQWTVARHTWRRDRLYLGASYTSLNIVYHAAADIAAVVLLAAAGMALDALATRGVPLVILCRCERHGWAACGI